VLTAVGAVSLVAVAFNLKLSPVTAVAGPLVVAVCTEFTSLILLRFVEERQRGFSPRRSMENTARRTGRAFVVSGATAVAGIGTLAASSMPLLSDFGTIVALNVTVALVCALVVLPPILVAAESRGWVTRGLLRTDEVPFIEFDGPRRPGSDGDGSNAAGPDPEPEILPAQTVVTPTQGAAGLPEHESVAVAEHFAHHEFEIQMSAPDVASQGPFLSHVGSEEAAPTPHAPTVHWHLSGTEGAEDHQTESNVAVATAPQRERARPSARLSALAARIVGIDRR
jgi:hypothetical protein